MTNQEAIKFLQQLYPNGGHCWLDEQRIEAIGMAVKALQEEPVELREVDLESYNKVQKIREEVARIQLYTQSEVLKQVLDYIDEVQKEPVSEDLGDYINELSKQFPEVSFAKLSRIAVRVAKWQQERDEADRAAVYKCGWNDRKAVMIAKAIDGKVIANGMGNPILHLWDKGKHLIDKKVKVILIKED